MMSILLYATVYALLYAGVLVWILERRGRKYGQGPLTFPEALVAGSLVLVVVYFINIIVLLTRPGAAAAFNLGLTGALAAFCLFREAGYRRRAKKYLRRQRAEARLMRVYLKKDPGNGACHERLSELYEKLGEKDKALESARSAVKLDPSVKNVWRVKQLEEN